jgi:hypothetical protein
MSSVAQQASLPKVQQSAIQLAAVAEVQQNPLSDLFYEACKDGNLKYIKIIIDNYTQQLPPQSLQPKPFTNPWLMGFTVITKNNKIDILKYLLENEQYLQIVNKVSGLTCTKLYEWVYLSFCRKGNSDIVKFILESEKDINFNHKFIYGDIKITGFSMACIYMHSNIIKLLLESNKAIDYDFTYIHLLDFSDKEFKKLVFDKMLNKLAAEQESNKQLEIKVAEIYDDFCTVQEENESLKRKRESSDDDSNKKSRA